MSDKRTKNLAMLASGLPEDIATQADEIEDQQPDTTSEQSQAVPLGKQKEIAALERAKENARSESVRNKLKEEILRAKLQKNEEEERKREELETIQAGKATASAAGNVYDGLKGAISNTTEKTQGLVIDASHKLASISTPGSIFLPITLLLLFFFLVLPVNGHTRAEWLYLAIVKKARIIVGSGGDFNSTDNIGNSTTNEPISTEGTLPIIWTPNRQLGPNPYIKRSPRL